MKHRKPIKSIIGTATLWMPTFTLMLLVLGWGIYRGFYNPGFLETPPSLQLITPLLIVSAMSIWVYYRLFLFYYAHIKLYNRLSKSRATSLLIGISLLPCIMMPVYYFRYIWPPQIENLFQPPTEHLKSLAVVVPPAQQSIWQQGWLWVEVGFMVLLALGAVALEIRTRQYNQPSGPLLYTIVTEPNWIADMAINPSSTQLLVATQASGASLAFYDLGDGNLIEAIQAPPDITSVTFTPDGQQIAYGQSSDSVIEYRSVSDLEASYQVQTEEDILGLDFLPDKPILITRFAKSGGVIIYAFPEHNQRAKFGRFIGSHHQIAISPDNRLIALPYQSDTVALRLLDGTLLHEISVLGYEVLEGDFDQDTSVAFSPDSQTLLTVYQGLSRYKMMQLWDVATGELKASIKPAWHYASNFVALPDGESYMIWLGNGRINRYLWSDHTVIQTLYHPDIAAEGGQLLLSPDGTRLVSAQKGNIWVWQLDSRGDLN
ncbi:MAG: WD40 repeat domain-containing protein [Chloroflexota bacterium]